MLTYEQTLEHSYKHAIEKIDYYIRQKQTQINILQNEISEMRQTAEGMTEQLKYEKRNKNSYTAHRFSELEQMKIESLYKDFIIKYNQIDKEGQTLQGIEQLFEESNEDVIKTVSNFAGGQTHIFLKSFGNYHFLTNNKNSDVDASLIHGHYANTVSDSDNFNELLGEIRMALEYILQSHKPKSRFTDAEVESISDTFQEFINGYNKQRAIKYQETMQDGGMWGSLASILRLRNKDIVCTFDGFEYGYTFSALKEDGIYYLLIEDAEEPIMAVIGGVSATSLYRCNNVEELNKALKEKLDMIVEGI